MGGKGGALSKEERKPKIGDDKRTPVSTIPTVTRIVSTVFRLRKVRKPLSEGKKGKQVGKGGR